MKKRPLLQAGSVILLGFIGACGATSAYADISNGVYTRPGTTLNIVINQNGVDVNGNTYTLSPFEINELNNQLDWTSATYLQKITTINIVPTAHPNGLFPTNEAATITPSDQGYALNFVMPPDVIRKSYPNLYPLAIYASGAIGVYAFNLIISQAARDEWSWISSNDVLHNKFNFLLSRWLQDPKGSLDEDIIFNRFSSNPAFLQQDLFLAALLANPPTTPACSLPDPFLKEPTSDCSNPAVVRTAQSIVIDSITFNLSDDGLSIISSDEDGFGHRDFNSPITIPQFFLDTFPVLNNDDPNTTSNRSPQSTSRLDGMSIISPPANVVPEIGTPLYIIGDPPTTYHSVLSSEGRKRLSAMTFRLKSPTTRDLADPALSPHRVTRN